MSSALEEKKQIVAGIKAKIKDSKSLVLVDYRGLNVKQDTDLRARFRKGGVEYKVIKNNLVRIAFEELGYKEFDNDLSGPTAVAFGHSDPVAPAKVLQECLKDFASLQIKRGLVEGKVIDVEGIKELASLPGKEVLLAKVLGMLNMPITSLASVLNNTIAGLAVALKAVADQKQ